MPVPITLKSALPSQELLFESMPLSEGLSTLGEMQLGLMGAHPDLKPEDRLGKPVTVQLPGDAKRHIHGCVKRCGIGARRGPYFGYQAGVQRWLGFLTHTADCRIFQDRTDGQRMIVSAREKLVLRCGKASITLTKAGKMLIEGSYLLSRSTGVNRIKGGSVQLN
jgi:Phage tail baseplate hub (GPD)